MNKFFQTQKVGSTLQKMIAIYLSLLSVFTLFIFSILFFIIIDVLGITGSSLYNASVIYLILVIFATGILLLASFILSSHLSGKIAAPINSYRAFLQEQLINNDIKLYSPDNSGYSEINNLIIVCNNLVSDYREHLKQAGKLSAVIWEKTRVAIDDIERLKDIELAQVQSISSVVQLSEQISGVLNDMSETFSSGSKTDRKTLKGMTSIFNTIQRFNSNLRNINAMLELVQHIGEQTNMLSVNAAIEAVKAGESGKGFSVVADEIKRLSEKISDSVFSVEEIIDNLNTEAKDILDLIDKNIDTGGELINSTYAKISTKTESINQLIKNAALEFDKNNKNIQKLSYAIHEISNAAKVLDNNKR